MAGMNVVQKPKLLPWLARRAGMPDYVVDTLWKKALTLAGIESYQLAEPGRQAKAMHYLLLLLGRGESTPAVAAGRSHAALAAACQ